MQEFTTAVKAHEEAEEGNVEGWTEFKQDEVVCRAKRPSPGQLAYLMASMHKRAPIEQQIAGAINFCMSIMDSETAAHLSDRLLDAEDDFDIEEIEQIVRALVAEWSGKATESSSGSSPSAGTTGSSLKPTTAVSTSSVSESIPI